MTRNIINILFYIIALFYVFMMADLLFRFSYIFDADRVVSRSYNLVPFKTISDYASGSINISGAFAVNIFGNIVVFIPYGLYLQVIKERKVFVEGLLIVFMTSVLVEVTQFVFGLGACDIDDVLLNTCGGFIGIIFYRFLRVLFRDEGRAKTAVGIISIIIGIPVIYLYFTTVFGHLRL